jgi:hypothetical protein
MVIIKDKDRGKAAKASYIGDMYRSKWYRLNIIIQ